MEGGARLAEECGVEREVRLGGGGEDWRGEEGRVGLRHGVGRGRTRVDEVKYRGGSGANLGGRVVGGDVVGRQAGGGEVGGEGSGGDKVVVVVDLVNHGGQSLDGLGQRSGVVVGTVVRVVVRDMLRTMRRTMRRTVVRDMVRTIARVVRKRGQSRTNDWTWRGDVVSRVEDHGRFWFCFQPRQDSNTHRLQVGNVLGTLRGLGSDTVSHVKRTDISGGDRSVGTWGVVDWSRGMERLRIIASGGRGGWWGIGGTRWVVFW